MERFTLIAESEFEKLVREIKIHVSDEIRDLMSRPFDEKPVFIDEAAQHLGVSNNTLRKRMRQGIPYHQEKDGPPYFFKSELTDYVKRLGKKGRAS